MRPCCLKALLLASVLTEARGLIRGRILVGFRVQTAATRATPPLLQLDLADAAEPFGAADAAEPFGAAERRALDQKLLWISGPAFCQFAVEPLARLVDTAYLGRLGPVAMGGAGAAIAAQYGLSKLYNDPLLRTTLSLVAASEGESECKGRAQKDAISTAMLLALLVGLIQAAFYGALAGPVLSACCVGPASPMRASALGYLRVAAAGSPMATLWLVVNAVFRGLGDTRTPLLYALLFTTLNAVLDPLLIFSCRMGAAGAAAGTAIAQSCALVPLLLALAHKIHDDQKRADRGGVRRARPLAALRELFIVPGGGRSGGSSGGRGGGGGSCGGGGGGGGGGAAVGALRSSLGRYMKAGSLVLFRTVGKISAYSIVAREAARLGAVSIAAHNL